MSQTLRTLGAGALGALIVAVAALSVRPGPVAGAPSDPATPVNTITVSATGKVTIVPDVARVNVGVTVNKTTVKASRDSLGQTMTSIVNALKGLGIAEADIQTSGLNLYPRYANGSSTKIIGYTMTEQLQVTVRDLDKAGDVVDTATVRGATEINGIWFDVSDPAVAQDDARAAAVTAARTSAQALAKAGNVTLGVVVSITDATPPQAYQSYARAGAVAFDALTKIEPGTQDLNSTVTVVFAIS
jgi:uncharacterized protein YggE